MSNYKGIYDGQSLKHYRTKGSKNGYSKDPNYKPIGDIAKGPEFYARMAEHQRQAMSDVNNSIAAYRRAQLANKAHSAVGKSGLLNNSYNHRSYQQAQAKAMQERNAAYGKAYGQMRSYGNAQAKANAAQRQAGINSAKNVGTTASHPTGQPNKGDYGAPKTAAERQAEVMDRRIKGTPMSKTAAERQAEVMDRRIKGGKIGTSYNNTKINSGYDAQKKMQADQSRRTNYNSLVSRRRAEESRSGVTANKAAAEARRIAGSKLGSGYVDSGAGNFRRGVKLAGQAIKERMNPSHKQRSMNKHYGEVINETVSKYHAKQAAKEIGTGIKKGADYAVNEGKKLVKKGKKKVKSLMKRFFN